MRVLESERAFERLQLTQSSMLDALVFGTFLNAALILTSSVPVGAALTVPARVSWALAGLFGLKIPLGLVKVSTEAHIHRKIIRIPQWLSCLAMMSSTY